MDVILKLQDSCTFLLRQLAASEAHDRQLTVRFPGVYLRVFVLIIFGHQSSPLCVPLAMLALIWVLPNMDLSPVFTKASKRRSERMDHRFIS